MVRAARVLLTLSLSAAVLVTGLPGLPAAAPAVAAPDEGPGPVREDETFTAYSKSELQDDGSWRAQVYDNPTFTKDRGSYRKADNKMVDNPDPVADPDTDKVAPNAWRETTFGKNGKKLVSFRLGGDKVTLSTTQLKLKKPVADSQGGLVYTDVATDTDLRVSPSGAGVRTEFTLKSAKAPTSFTFRLSDKGDQLGTPSRAADGSWTFSTEIEKGVRFGFDPAYAYEKDLVHPEYAPGAEAGSARLDITAGKQAGKGEWDVTKSVDPNWLKGKTFPIVLDPSASFGRAQGYSTRDCHVVNGGGVNNNYCASGVTEVGYGTGANVTGDVVRRQVTQTDFANSIPADAKVDRAVLSLFFRRNYQNVSFPISAYRTGQYWSNAATWFNYDGSHAWTTQATNPVGGELSRVQVGSACVQGGRCEWNITSLAQSWINRSLPYDGVSLLMSSERSVRAVQAFSSAENEFSTQWPFYRVDYRIPPNAPANVNATEDDGSSNVTWSVPFENGTAIDRYQVDAIPVGSSTVERTDFCYNRYCTQLRMNNLVNGRAYTFRVRAHNSADWSEYGTSPSGRNYVPYGVPGNPFNVTANADPAASSLRVAWGSPNNNGRGITGYTVRASTPGGPDRSVSCTGNSCDVGGLANGKNYSVTVAAVNARGEGGQSGAATATPYDRPSAPPGLTVSSGDASVQASWGASADNGRPVLDYTVVLKRSGTTVRILTLSGSARSTSFDADSSNTAVVNGQPHTVEVSARNARGTGATATGGPTTPSGLPGAPTGVRATASDGQVKADWLRPDDNGAPLTRYDVELRDSQDNLVDTRQVTTNLTAGSQSVTFTGLTNGDTFYVRVRAANARGNGEWARSGGTVTPLLPLMLEKISTSSGKPVGPGDTVAYTLKVTNPNGKPVSAAKITDEATAGLTPVLGLFVRENADGTKTPICATGGACTSAPKAGGLLTTVKLPDLPAKSTTTFSYPAQADTQTGDGACKTVTNTASITDVLGTRRSNTDPVGVLACGGALGLEKWFTTPGMPVGPQTAMSVNVANGNAVVQAVDSTPVQAHGALTQVLRRTYNSQNTDAVSLPGSLGAGWTFNFGESDDAGLSAGGSSLRLPNLGDALATVRNPLGVVLVDRDGTRHQFTPRNAGLGLSVDPAVNPGAAKNPLTPVVLPTVGVCVDVNYNAPKGVHLGLWRYVKVGNGSCGNITTRTDAVVVGYATVRPDRMRAEYDARGRLLAITDPAGVQLSYLYTADLPSGTTGTTKAALTAGRLSAIYESRSCKATDGKAITDKGQLPGSCRAFRFDYSGAVPTLDDDTTNNNATPVIKVTDPAGRITDYELDRDLGASPTNPTAHLMAVRDVDGGRTQYTYGGCGGSADQLCTIRDRRGNLTRLGYAATGGDPAGSPQRLTSIIDRRGTRTTYEYPSATRTVVKTANTKFQGDAARPVPNAADSATPNRRTVYDGIDSDSRVHTVEDFDDSSGARLRRTDMSWDTGCYQPLPQGSTERPDNNLCTVVRKADAAGAPAAGQAGDERTDWLYNPEGMALRQRQALAGSATLDTTFGYDTQYAGPSGPNRPAKDRVAGSGNVTSPDARSDMNTLYAVSDRVQSLSPRGNSAGAAFTAYLTTMTVDNDPTKPINTENADSCVAGADGMVAARHNTGHVCQTSTPSSTTDAKPSLTRSSFDTFGQKATSTTAKAIAEAPAGVQPKATVYRYYADPAQPGDDASAPKDITGTIRSGGWLRDTVDPEGNFVAFDYDRAGNVVRTWDRDATDGNNRDSYPAANVTADRTAPGAVPAGHTQVTYGPAGGTAYARPWRYVLTSTDQLGQRTDTEVDPNGNPTRIRPPRGSEKGNADFDVLATFDGGDLPLTTATPLQKAAGTGTRMSYDAYGAQTSMVGPDTAGEQPGRHATTMRYDATGRMTATRTSRDSTAPAGSPAACATAGEGDRPLVPGRVYCTTSTSYDALDNPVARTDAAGAKSTAVFDAVHRPTDVYTPRGADGVDTLRTRTDYDSDGRPVRVCGPRQYTEGGGGCTDSSLFGTRTVYNPAGLPTSAKQFRQTGQELTTTMAYDADGNMVASTDPRGTATDGTSVTVKSTFDLLGRQRSVAVPRGGTTALTTTMVYSPSGDKIATAAPGETDDNPGGPAVRVTGSVYDAAHRPTDTVQALQVSALTTAAVQAALKTATADADAQRNLRTRTVYDADDNPIAVFAPRAFTAGGDKGSPALLADPDRRFMAATSYDRDGRAVSQLVPRTSSASTDPTGTGGEQSTQCRTGADGYPGDVGLCRTDIGYDLLGNRTSVLLPTRTADGDSARKVTYAWTDDNLLRQVDAPDPSSGGRIAAMRSVFDGEGRPTAQTNAEGHTTTTVYTRDGLVDKVTGPQGPNNLSHVTNYDYNADGQPTVIGTPRTTPGGSGGQEPVTVTSYTADGLVAAATEGRLREQAAAASTSADLMTSYRYDGAGNAIEVLSPSGNAGQSPNAGRVPVRMTWTADSLLAKNAEPVIVTGGGAQLERATTYGYDRAGRKTSASVDTAGSGSGTGSAQTQKFGYYPSDALKVQYGRAPQDQNGPKIDHGYDADGNQSALTDQASGRTVAGSFYADGLPREVRSGARRTAWSYDGAGAPVRRGEGPASGALAVTFYDRSDAGLVSAMRAPLDGTNGELGRSSWTHDRLGRPVSGTRPDGSTQTWGWRADDLLGTTKVQGAGGGMDMLASWQYGYDELGRILSQDYMGKGSGATQNADPGSGSGTAGAEPGTGQMVSYSSSYDTAGRLATFTDAKGKRTVSFDKDNNRTVYGRAGEPEPSSYGYRADGSIAASTTTDSTGTSRERQYAYAPFGGVVDDGCTAYGYDGFDRLTRTGPTGQPATPPEAGCATMPDVTFGYDGMDRQISRTTSAALGLPGSSTAFDYDGWTGSLTRQDTTGGPTGTAGVLAYTLAADGNTTTAAKTGSPAEFLFDDGTGSTGLTTTRSTTTGGATGTAPAPMPAPTTSPAPDTGTGAPEPGDERVRCVSRYDAYGTPDGNTALPVTGACASGSAHNDTFYRGNRREGSTGNYQLGSRTYDPAKAGFLTPDSYRTGGSNANASIGIDPLTRNTYAYVNGDPINLSDPDGHRQIEGTGEGAAPRGSTRTGGDRRGTGQWRAGGTAKAPADGKLHGQAYAERDAGGTIRTFYDCNCDQQLVNDVADGTITDYDVTAGTQKFFYDLVVGDYVDCGNGAVNSSGGFGTVAACVFSAPIVGKPLKGLKIGIKSGLEGLDAVRDTNRAGDALRATDNAAEAVGPAVSDPRLGRALADDFRGGPNPIGDGSALDAARHTVRTGDLVVGSTHLEKAVEMRDRYARSLRRGGLNPADEAVARSRYDAYRTFVDEFDLDSMMRARGLR